MGFKTMYQFPPSTNIYYAQAIKILEHLVSCLDLPVKEHRVLNEVSCHKILIGHYVNQFPTRNSN